MSNSENNNPQDTSANEKKKLSLQEAMKQMLENKKSGKTGGKSGSVVSNTSKQSQHTKKPNNQRRKTGGA